MIQKQFKLDADRLFFTSDTHAFHGNVIQHCPVTRSQFADVGQMNDCLVDAWNSKVPRNGIVFHAGDVAFGSFRTGQLRELLSRLNGTIHLIEGNHDERIMQKPELASRFASINQMLTIAVKDRTIVISHFALRTWYSKRYGAYHLYGHSHGTLPGLDRSMDIGVDARPNKDLAPWSFAEIDNILSTIDYAPQEL